ncbi:MAG: sigma-70 family RNA polymerase sigma factor [Acidobacteriota bacterium]
MKPAPALSWPDVADQEAVIVSRCVEGDEEACSALVAQHQRLVLQLAFHLLGDYEDARDLSQDVFLQVFRTIGRFRRQSAMRTWIYRIVINQARNRQRWWRRRRRADQISLDQHIEENGDRLTADGSLDPHRMLNQKHLASQVWQALDGLPFEQRTAIILREIDGLSYDEIAFSLGIAIGTVKSRLTRAREALRARLRDVRVA